MELHQNAGIKIGTVHTKQQQKTDPIDVDIELGQTGDIQSVLDIVHKWYKLNLSDLSLGYLSVTYTASKLQMIIDNGDLIVLKQNGVIVGYCLVNNVVETERLRYVKDLYYKLSKTPVNTPIVCGYQVVFDTPIQNKGLYKQIITEAISYFKKKYPILVTTISKNNNQSIFAHKHFGWTFYDTDEEYYLVSLP